MDLVCPAGSLPALKAAVDNGADGVFEATEVLAKHDENYMPPDAKHAIEQAQKARRLQELDRAARDLFLMGIGPLASKSSGDRCDEQIIQPRPHSCFC